MDGFNISTAIGVNPGGLNTNYLDHYFSAMDMPTSLYTLRLSAIFEGTMVNGRVVQTGPNQLPFIQYMPPIPAVVPMFSYNITINSASTTQQMKTLTLANTYWFKVSNKNVCPDTINGRYCVKFTITFNYAQNAQNTILVFVWQLISNQVFATSMTQLANGNPQVLNNLGFLSLENNIVLTDTANQFPVQTTPVQLQLRSDNITNNGIWAIYTLGTALNVKVTHDPVFGINNNGLTLTTQIVTIALSVGIVLVFLVILGCSVYIYNGNTKEYYRKLRVIQDTDE
jgi:hypothetical protein